MKRTKPSLVGVSCALLFVACGPSSVPPEQSLTITQERIAFGELPSHVEAAGGFIWVLDRWNPQIGKIDPATNEVVDVFDLSSTIGSNGFISDMTTARGSLWVTAPDKQLILKLDMNTGEVEYMLRTDGAVIHIAYEQGSLWYLSGGGGVYLERFDVGNKRTVARVRLGPNNTFLHDMFARGEAIWILRNYGRFVAGQGRDSTWFGEDGLWRLDLETNRVTERRKLGSTLTRGPVNPVTGDLESSGDDVWMSRVHERRLLRMATATGRVRQTIQVSDFDLPWEFSLVGGDIWIGDLNEPTVMWIDPDTGDRETVDVGSDTSYIGGGFGSAWVPVSNETTGTGEVIRLTHD